MLGICGLWYKVGYQSILYSGIVPKGLKFDGLVCLNKKAAIRGCNKDIIRNVRKLQKGFYG